MSSDGLIGVVIGRDERVVGETCRQLSEGFLRLSCFCWGVSKHNLFMKISLNEESPKSLLQAGPNPYIVWISNHGSASASFSYNILNITEKNCSKTVFQNPKYFYFTTPIVVVSIGKWFSGFWKILSKYEVPYVPLFLTFWFSRNSRYVKRISQTRLLFLVNFELVLWWVRGGNNNWWKFWKFQKCPTKYWNMSPCLDKPS